jgi:hypothetical protein
MTLSRLLAHKFLWIGFLQRNGKGFHKILCLRQPTFGARKVEIRRFDSFISQNSIRYLLVLLICRVTFHLQEINVL